MLIAYINPPICPLRHCTAKECIGSVISPSFVMNQPSIRLYTVWRQINFDLQPHRNGYFSKFSIFHLICLLH